MTEEHREKEAGSTGMPQPKPRLETRQKFSPSIKLPKINFDHTDRSH
ncbi:hypothetical protein [Nocardia sp. NPDC050793]